MFCITGIFAIDSRSLDLCFSVVYLFSLVLFILTAEKLSNWFYDI